MIIGIVVLVWIGIIIVYSLVIRGVLGVILMGVVWRMNVKMAIIMLAQVSVTNVIIDALFVKEHLLIVLNVV